MHPCLIKKHLKVAHFLGMKKALDEGVSILRMSMTRYQAPGEDKTFSSELGGTSEAPA
jgi:hypothetical protein